MNRVLLVNDEESITDKTTGMLETLGWEVARASSRDTALWLCVSGKPNLVIVDIEMTGGSGLETISTIRRTDKSVHILAVTRGRNEKTLLKVAEVCGANQHLIGPVSRWKLSAVIEASPTGNHTSIE